MGKYDEEDAAGRAAADAATEWDDIAGLNKEGLQKLFPIPGDLAAAERLMEVVDKSTERKRIITAMQSFAVIATAGGIEALKGASKLAKKVLLVAIMALFAVPASAGILDLNPIWDWMGENANKSMVGLGVNFKGKSAGVGFVPLAWDKKRGYWHLGVGYTTPKIDQVGDNIAAGAGINFYAAGRDLLRNVFKDRVEILPLPPLFIGPMIEAPPLNNISETWVIGERVWITVVYRFLKPKEQEGTP